MLRSAVTAAALAAFALPAVAQAGEPFTVGEGSHPHIAIQPGDTAARIVWMDDVADKVHYCAVPRGATACSVKRILDAPWGGPSRPFVVNGSGAKVYIGMASAQEGKTYVYTSSNGGQNWSGPDTIYKAGGGTNAFEPVLNNAQSELVFPTDNPSLFVHSVMVNGSENGGTATATLETGGTNDLRDLQLARLTGGTSMLAVGHNGESAYFWKLPSGDPSVSANWPSAPTLIGEGSEARLAPGEGNPWLLTGAGPAGAKRMEIRRWNGTAFGSATVLAGEQGYINDVASQGASVAGAIWRRNEPGPAHRLRFARSTNAGGSWSTSTIAFDDAVMASMDLALASDGEGFAAYEGKPTPTSNAKRFIRVASTDTVPEPPVKPTTTTKTETPTTPPPPPVTPVTPTTPPTPPTKPAALVRTVGASVKGATLSLNVPTGCIPAGRPFVATLSWTKRKRKGNLFVKVSRTDFSIGAKRVKIDRAAPFRQTLKIPSPKAGQRYTLRARAFIKVRRGKAPKKSIATTLTVCG